jgi:hypothetical protein
MGRLAEEITFSNDRERRRNLADRALETARRLGDASVLGSVLKNIHGGLWMPEGFENRSALAEEGVRLATTAGDASMLLDAHLFRFFAHLECGDMRAAQSDIAASSRWAASLKQVDRSWVLALAESCRALALGRLDESERRAESAFQLGEPALGSHAGLARTIQLAHLRWLGGRFEDAAMFCEDLSCEFPALQRTLDCAAALSLCELGHLDEARDRLERLSSKGFSEIPRDATRTQNLIFLTLVCAGLKDGARAAQLYDCLHPLRHHVVVFAPVLMWGAASHFLGLLATTMGSDDVAAEHFEDALARNTRNGTKQWVARPQLAYAELLMRSNEPAAHSRATLLLEQAKTISVKLGMGAVLGTVEALLEGRDPRPTIQSPPDGEVRRDRRPEKEPDNPVGRPLIATPVSAATLRLDPVCCWMQFKGRECVLPDLKGLRFLAVLLQNPGTEFRPRTLLALVDPPELQLAGGRIGIGMDRMNVEGGLGPILDARAKEEYKHRVGLLVERYEEAVTNNDAAASELLKEIEAIKKELAGAVGRCGRDRPVCSADERARVLVTKNMKTTAFRKIAALHPTLARHLRLYVNTGDLCSYTPDPDAPTWLVEGSIARGPQGVAPSR